MVYKSSLFYDNAKYFSSDPDFPLTIVIRSPQNRSSFHRHEFCECAFVTSGCGKHQSEEHQPVTIRRGDIIVIPKGGRHAFVDADGLSVINLLFDVSHLPSMLLELYSKPVYKELFLRDVSHYEEKDFPKFAPPPDAFSEMEEYLKRMAASDGLKKLHCYKLGLFMALMSLLCDSKAPETADSSFVPLDITKLLLYLERNYNHRIYLDQLAGLTCMSRASLLRHFHAAFGVTPIAYLQRIRLKHVAEMLENSRNSLKEIAILCGFPSESYLFRTFKAAYGMTPLTYRKNRNRF